MIRYVKNQTNNKGKKGFSRIIDCSAKFYICRRLFEVKKDVRTPKLTISKQNTLKPNKKEKIYINLHKHSLSL